MGREAQSGEVRRPASPEGRTATATPDDGVGGPVPRLPRGATLGRYVVLDCLGSGGMGVVYVAHDFALDRRVSLKLLRPSGKDPEGRRERLVSEAQALARVSHPNVLTVHDVGTWEDEVYLALEHVEGETLQTWLDRAPRSPAEIRGMFLQAARGLQAIHDAGLIHRDVKPENLLVGRDGRLRVADLGLAITTGSAAAGPARETLRPGTPGYMPLEQHRGEPLDARADQFSLAVALHEALLGHRPYGSRGASRESLEARLGRGPAVEVPRSPAIPPRLRRALTAALSPDRSERPASLLPLIEALVSPGVNTSSTVGGSLAVAAAAGLLLLAVGRGSATPVARAEAAPWLPPAWEFQTETVEAVEPAERMSLATTALWRPVAGEAIGREPSTARGQGSSEGPSLSAPSAPLTRSPEVLTLGHRPGEPAATAAPAPGATLDLARLAELNGLVQALYRALTDPREAGATGPLLALSPGLATGGPVSSATTPGLGAAPVQVASAASAGGSGPDYVDPTGQTIAAIERRLDQQIRQNRSPPEIAETRFTLAQAIWNSSDAEETQTRALTLARQSKAALDAVPHRDTDVSVTDLLDAVNEWISVREGPIGKPNGNLVGTNRAQLKLAPVDTTRGPTNTGF
jgi:serine/threonine protein kinase